jgi:hypothetical protein
MKNQEKIPIESSVEQDTGHPVLNLKRGNMLVCVNARAGLY